MRLWVFHNTFGATVYAEAVRACVPDLLQAARVLLSTEPSRSIGRVRSGILVADRAHSRLRLGTLDRILEGALCGPHGLHFARGARVRLARKTADIGGAATAIEPAFGRAAGPRPSGWSRVWQSGSTRI